MRLKIVGNQIINTIKESLHQGVLWFFGGSVVSQICGLISSIIVIRRLSKIDYGNYVDASNLYAYISMFVGLGMASAVMQFCSEKRSNRKAVYRFTLFFGEALNLILLAVVLLIAIALRPIKGDQVSAYLSKMSCLPLVVYLHTYFEYVFRIKKDNVKYGIIQIIYSVLILFSKIALTIIFGVDGLIYSMYLTSIICIIVELIMLHKEGFLNEIRNTKEIIEKTEKKQIIKYSAICSITNFSSRILVLLDVTCLGFILSDAEILADYNVALSLPTALGFVATCLITFYYPLIVEKYTNNLSSFGQYVRKITYVFLFFSTVISAFLFIFAPVIINVLYGEKYYTAVPVMRILCINFFIATGFRRLFGNIIAAMKRVEINLLHTVLAGGLNIILDILFIKYLGSIGAAIATTLITLFVTILEFMFLKKNIKAFIL